MISLPVAAAVLAATSVNALPPPGGPAPPAPPAPAPCKPKPFGFFANNTIYQTTGSESITYPHFIESTDGTILATSALSAGREPGGIDYVAFRQDRLRVLVAHHPNEDT
ncbi:hypothetical protein BDZ85DRAFT_282292 [Elsinoe ampelina]|uniref:Uncharacterized protein n=1 Tax=Elsinoe ampelina TaxID=302913 RepID=A0A6A6GC97_9PEZI|nr:hypothetical protein BDZ85DRAFT_282292 [Elsinoe ampelina]